AIVPEGRDFSGRVTYTHYTFKQLSDQSDIFACGLEHVGIKKGDKVVLMVKPSLDFFVTAFGLFKAGVVPVLVDPGIGTKNMGVCIQEVDPTGFIGIAKAHVGRLIFKWGKKTIKNLITVGKKGPWGGVTLDEVLEKGKQHFDSSKLLQNKAEDMACIAFTSGSTGVPKGVVYNHTNFISQLRILSNVYDTSEGTIDLPTLPLFALFSPVMGITAVIPDMDFTKPANADPKKIIEAIENFGIRSMFGSPALINTLSRYGVANNIKLPTLKRIISAGAPVPAVLQERFSKMLEDDADIYTPYGATECLPIAWTTHKEILSDTRFLTDKGKGVCIGKPSEELDVRIIKITDEPIENYTDDLKLKTGEVGEILVKGENVTLYYYNREESTKLAKIKDSDGVIMHRMGDVGYYDEQGRLWFCGRKAHRVITKEETLFTIPCEAIYNTHPDVYRSALVGITKNGQVESVMCIELEPESKNKDKEKIKKELVEIASKFDHTKNIKHILFHDSFPVDIRHNSKIFREKLAVWANEVIK
ncbi:MAG: fatty acid CoA ligase family protein, partial [Candidatus Sericytochromatia bacterium]